MQRRVRIVGEAVDKPTALVVSERSILRLVASIRGCAAHCLSLQVVPAQEPDYLAPYFNAARRHGGGFGALLWASPQTQAARFDAICRLEHLNGRSILDLGCGRADLLEYCRSQRIIPADYLGIEAVPDLAAAAQITVGRHRHARIVQADFVEQPAAMMVGAQVVAISGALDALAAAAFYATIRRAFHAATEALVFNFLDSAFLAAAAYLEWHSRADVLAFAKTLSPDIRVLHDYLEGDSTVAIRKGQQT
jgi:hypothetical protein